MYNPISELRRLALTAHCTQYDEEAMTSLELAGRTALKVNECVKLVNAVCDYLEKHLDETLLAVINERLASGEIFIENNTLVLVKEGE